jgi:hypothetical protein
MCQTTLAEMCVDHEYIACGGITEDWQYTGRTEVLPIESRSLGDEVQEKTVYFRRSRQRAFPEVFPARSSQADKLPTPNATPEGQTDFRSSEVFAELERVGQALVPCLGAQMTGRASPFGRSDRPPPA